MFLEVVYLNPQYLEGVFLFKYFFFFFCLQSKSLILRMQHNIDHVKMLAQEAREGRSKTERRCNSEFCL